MKPQSILFAASLITASAMASADEQSTVYDGLFGADANPELTSFAEALMETFSDEDLRRFFDGDAHTTVFAPTDEAMDEYLTALSEAETARFDDPNTGWQERFLLFHIAQGDWDWVGVTAAGEAAAQKRPAQPGYAAASIGGLRMLDDNIAHVHRDGELLKIEQATIFTERPYRNGLIAQIDTVLSPNSMPAPVGCSPFVSKHNNNLYFLQRFASMTASFNWLSVTHCQPYDSPPSYSTDSFLVVAGRHDSSGPAGSFKSGLGVKNMIVTEDWGNNEPSNLNFAFSTEMTVTMNSDFPEGAGAQSVTVTCKDVRFGQGSTDATNNWWVGQPGAFTCDRNPYQDMPGIVLQCTDTSGNSQTLMLAQINPYQGDIDDSFANMMIPADGECPPCLSGCG